VPPHLFMVLIDDLGYHNGNPILALLFSPILNVSASTQVHTCCHCFHGTTSCTHVLGTSLRDGGDCTTRPTLHDPRGQQYSVGVRRCTSVSREEGGLQSKDANVAMSMSHAVGFHNPDQISPNIDATRFDFARQRDPAFYLVRSHVTCGVGFLHALQCTSSGDWGSCFRESVAPIYRRRSDLTLPVAVYCIRI
jgi:hypothetical protein